MSSRVRGRSTFAQLIDRGILEIGDGYRAKNSELGGQGPIFLRAGKVRPTHIDFSDVECFHESLAEKVAAKSSQEGDVIVTTKGNSTGRVSFVTADMPRFVYSPHLSYWRSLDRDKLSPGFLRYWSMSKEFRDQLAGLAASTDMAPYLSLVDQKRLRITLPAPEDQERIAHVLGTLDDKIELNRRMNQTLEAIARAIFKSWFVDFDPVHAKAEGRDPVGMDPETAALFPDSFQDSPLGKIPNGWEVGRLGELLELSRESIKPHEHPTEEFDYLSIPAYDAGSPARELGGTIRSSKYLVSPSAVLISKLNPHIPRVWLPGVSEARRSICSTEFLVCIPREGVSREYIYSLLSSAAFLDEFAQMVTGTTGSHQRVRPTAFTAMRVVRPSLDLMAAFTRRVRPLLLRCSGHLRESDSLASARDLLLPRLLSGGLSLSEGDTDG